MHYNVDNMLKVKLTKTPECFVKPQSLVLLLLPCFILITLYWISDGEPDYERFQYITPKSDNISDDELVAGYLVYNPKCHILSKNPLDPSIKKFVKKEKFEKCSTAPPLTRIEKKSNGSVYLVINEESAKKHKNLTCCWSKIVRPSIVIKITADKEYDSRISVGPCVEFDEQVFVPSSVQSVSVICKKPKFKKAITKIKGKIKGGQKQSSQVVYENVHAILNADYVRERTYNGFLEILNYRNNNATIINATTTTTNTTTTNATTANNQRPLSVLMLGIDSVSRLNFHRSMMRTRDFFDDRGWIELKGYNKMGDNTFPNLMAFLTGKNQTTAYSQCKPKTPYGMDNCSLIWYNFRDAGYVTGYGEDLASISTFNYLKLGFVEPPTDYYMRPYVLATEKLLKSRTHFNTKYCSGPEITVDRIFDYGVEFAKTFLSVPYFGFFWTNSISHEEMNGPSSYDQRFLEKLSELESSGVTNDSMIVVLSDHGMRYGSIRNTMVGWYEERLPFVYVWLPDWFREQDPEAYASLRLNKNRLTSPYDLYETLRDVLTRAGGRAESSTGCPSCGSLFRPVPYVRGCGDAGVASHWCTCNTFEPADPTDKIVLAGAYKFVEHIDDLVKRYKGKKGARMCAKLKLKRIMRVSKIIDLEKSFNCDYVEFMYLLETTPGGGQFETTIRYHGSANYTIQDEQVSRINLYRHSARCLKEGYKQYCQCV